MRTLMKLVPILLLSVVLVFGTGFGQQKLAQTGMKFLNVTVDARAASLGEAYTSIDGLASSMFFNPAGMGRMTDLANVAFGQVQWIADIKHNYASVAVAPAGGEYGVIGLMLQSVDYGDLQATVRSDNDAGYLDMGTFNPTALMIGLGYSRALSDKFSIGGVAKWIHQNLGSGAVGLDGAGGYSMQDNITNIFAFDFGLIYKTGFKSLQFGMVVRNFSKEARYITEGFQLPLTFRIGVSMNLMDLFNVDREMHGLLFSVDAEHPRDYPERMKWGAEYVFMKIFSVRAGFISLADEQKFSYGLGLQKTFGTYGLGIDYAYTPFTGGFSNVNTFTFKFSF